MSRIVILWTPVLVILAGVGSALGNADTDDAPPQDSGFIRPGAEIIHPNPCTVGFLHSYEGALGFSTAGHCAANGSRIFVRDELGIPRNVGEVVRSVADGPGRDFAIVRIDSTWVASTNPCFPILGGPSTSGLSVSAPEILIYTGWGIATPGVTRVGLAAASDSERRFVGVASPGDSGGPVIALEQNGESAAFGIITHLSASSESLQPIVVTSAGDLPGTLVTCPSRLHSDF